MCKMNVTLWHHLANSLKKTSEFQVNYAVMNSAATLSVSPPKIRVNEKKKKKKKNQAAPNFSFQIDIPEKKHKKYQ